MDSLLRTLLSKIALHGLPCLLALYAIGLPTQAFGNEPIITGSIKNKRGDRIVVLKTNEPHLYYIVPDKWQIHNKQVFLELNEDESTPDNEIYSLTFILGPVYKESEEITRQIKKEDRRALFLAAPKKFTTATLNFPPELGGIVKELTPVSTYTSSEFFYYRVSLTAPQVYTLSDLTVDNILMTGLLTYEFPYEGTPLETFSEIHLNLQPSDIPLPGEPLGGEHGSPCPGLPGKLKPGKAFSSAAFRIGLPDPDCKFQDSEQSNLVW